MFWLQGLEEPIAFYARVSSEEQKRGETIGAQTEAAEKFATHANVRFAAIYLDDGVSGAVELAERPEGRRIIEAARAGAIKTLLVVRVDRLGRSARHSLNTAYELRAAGVKIHSLTEPFDTDTPIGQYLFTNWANNAELERNTILERLRTGSRRWAAKGNYLGGIVPYGYKVEDRGRARKFIVPDEDPLPGFGFSQAEIVRMLYHWVANDHRSGEWCADTLNSMGIPPAYVRDGRKVKAGERTESTAGVWRATRICHMIANTTYKGVSYYGKRHGTTSLQPGAELISREVEPIVDEDTWERARQVRRENQCISPKNSTRSYLLRGKIKCARCGGTFCGVSYGTEKAHRYICSNKSHRHPAKVDGQRNLVLARCPSMSLRGEDIETIIWEQISGFLRDPGSVLARLTIERQEAVQRAKEATEAAAGEEGQAAVQRIEKALAGKEDERERAITLYRRGRINDEELDRQLAECDAEVVTLRAEVERLACRRLSETATLQRINSVETLLRELAERVGDGMTFEQKRAAIEVLLESIVINDEEAEGKTGRWPKRQAVLNVRYRFADPAAGSGKTGAKGQVRGHVDKGTYCTVTDSSPRSG